MMAGVATVDLDDRTHELVRFAARTFGVSEAEVVARAVHAFSERDAALSRPGRNPWEPVPVYGEYDGHRVEGSYLPATRRLTVTSGDLAGTRFKTASGAARAAASALRADGRAPAMNGWRFWRLVETDERLEVLR